MLVDQTEMGTKNVYSILFSILIDQLAIKSKSKSKSIYSVKMCTPIGV